MWFRHLTAAAACAAILGLAASGLVRTGLFDVLSALARPTSEPSPADDRILPEASLPSVVERGTEGVAPADCPTAVVLTTATKGRRPARPSPSRKAAPDTLSQELARGIRKLAERRYEIRRSTLELALGNLGALASWVRATPDLRDGKPFGFRLFAVSADGPFARLGLRNDDVLVSINGLNLATPDRVLEAYGKLRKTPHLALGLVREGHELTLDYTIR
jgi:hypothetical protein